MSISCFLQHRLSRCIGWMSKKRVPWLVQACIRWFIRQYKVNMAEAENPDPSSYATFNAFFTRALKAHCRPIASNPDHLLAPCDSQWLQAAPSTQQPIYAKGAAFDCAALLANDRQSKELTAGGFANFYLAPNNYHRIHMPIDAELRAMTYVPGCLHSVDPQRMPNTRCIYSENERLICYFDSAHGQLAMVLVGALNVGSIETVWHGVVKRHKQVQRWHYDLHKHRFCQGQEIGRFNLGSTVIICMPKCPSSWKSSHQARAVQYGSCIAELNEPK